MTFSVRYMGSKRSLASRIAGKISTRHPKAAVLDVFSGMCAVGTELAPRHRVLTNDIHAFAETVAHALFVAPALPPTSLIARDELLPRFRENASALKASVRERLQAEAEALARCDEAGGWRRLFEFTEVDRAHELPMALDGLPSLSTYRAAPSTFPFSLVSSYFVSGYFGVRQSIEIDSLRYAIEGGPEEHKAYYLAALLQSMSRCAAAPGHFAQYLVPRDRTNTRYIAKVRGRSVLESFYDALDAFPQVMCLARDKNITFRSEATALLKQDAVRNSTSKLVIYADPPYSRAQYSRYYHVLETVTLYDYPECLGKGRYRSDRHQTAFSQKARVRQAFEDFVQSAAATGAPLYLSYPTNGLLSTGGTDVTTLLRSVYKNVEVCDRVPLSHSTMGASPGYASVKVFEDVYYASNID